MDYLYFMQRKILKKMEISKDNYPYNRKFILTFLLCKILKEDEKMFKNTKGQEKGITLIALVITIVLNCSCLAMERMLKNVNILKI